MWVENTTEVLCGDTVPFIKLNGCIQLHYLGALNNDIYFIFSRGQGQNSKCLNIIFIKFLLSFVCMKLPLKSYADR